ncbi:MAG TPA: Kae1-associated kinase Bud32 [Methanothrix sp.]|jgi:Kae1-associated kinase Bud32|uniref:Kae1-associated kinase Bud32 n=2 Tax=Methanothrix sp. TaxID=90426 RepID=UPI002B941984|nr:Kae1-associated kinase Bud32 [Methanothrix sp.]
MEAGRWELAGDAGLMEIGRGAEAVITLENGVVRKWRLPKSYRLPALDERIRQERTIREARITSEARRHGVLTPIICDVSRFELRMEHVQGDKLKDVICPELSSKVGEMVGKLHRGGIIHGDLTTSNMILVREEICLIDFGLAFYERSVEAQGVDVHVYFQTLESTHDRPEELIESFKSGYLRVYPQGKAVLERVKEIKARGRYL